MVLAYHSVGACDRREKQRLRSQVTWDLNSVTRQLFGLLFTSSIPVLYSCIPWTTGVLQSISMTHLLTDFQVTSDRRIKGKWGQATFSPSGSNSLSDAVLFHLGAASGKTQGDGCWASCKAAARGSLNDVPLTPQKLPICGSGYQCFTLLFLGLGERLLFLNIA